VINLFSITKIITAFSGLYAVLLFTLLPFFDIEINISSIFKYTAIFEIIIILILIVGWRFIWNKIPKLNDWLFPDINGTWNVEIHWKWKQEDGSLKKGIKKGEVVIKQNFLTLSMELFTDESESETLVIQPKKNTESGRVQFYYIYKNTPIDKGNNKLSPHIGTVILKVAPNNNDILEGNYFTDRNTQGFLKFIRKNT
jgi:hypothetical protein